jgi:hypothetical protein
MCRDPIRQMRVDANNQDGEVLALLYANAFGFDLMSQPTSFFRRVA